VSVQPLPPPDVLTPTERAQLWRFAQRFVVGAADYAPYSRGLDGSPLTLADGHRLLFTRWLYARGRLRP
jgi:hypothetical protein